MIPIFEDNYLKEIIQTDISLRKNRLLNSDVEVSMCIGEVSVCVRLKQFHFRKLEYNLSSISFFFGFYALIVICMAFSNNVKIQWGKINILFEQKVSEKFRLRAIY